MNFVNDTVPRTLRSMNDECEEDENRQLALLSDLDLDWADEPLPYLHTNLPATTEGGTTTPNCSDVMSNMAI